MRTPGPRERGLAHRDKWPQYAAGMLAESAFILGLTLIAYILAVIAKAVF